MSNLPAKARVVIVGGGIVGCSVAYHLTKLGWKDVVLLKRKQLTCGTTWHAAGLIGQLRASANMTRLAKYSADLYRGLEAETGLATGMKTVGLDLGRADRGAQGGAFPLRLDGAGFRGAGRGDVAVGGEGAISASEYRGREGGRLAADGRAGRSGEYRAGARQGRPAARSAGRRGGEGYGDHGRGPPGDEGRLGAGRRDRTRSSPITSSIAAECGAAKSAAWPGSTCRSMPASISTS